MNHIYRSIWNEKTGTFVAVSENTNSGGKKASAGGSVVAGTSFALKALAVSLMLAFGPIAYALPIDGQVTAGSATITGSSNSMTINQSSQNAALNWQSFNIGQAESVKFVQPNSSSVALNRVLGADPSSILGGLSANGKVFLVNPNGILFGKGASVNVGGLVASTLNISNSDFMAGKYKFAGAGNGSVTNQGAINADGGYVALLGANVSNEGTINARLGTIALAAGNAITLDVAGDGLLNVKVDQGAVSALVNNGGMLQADGGEVLLTAQAAGTLLRTAINNTGIIQAQTIENHNGTIKLLGDMQSGAINVGGTLDARAPNGGNGGFIESSAAQVKIADNAKITTAAAMGLNGTWLIDPVDFTITASGGDMTGAALTTSLGSGNVTIQSTSGSTGTAGDVNVNDAVSWSANKLTLNAQNNININANLNASATASLALEFGQGAVAAGNASNIITNGGVVNLPANTTNFATKQGSNGSVEAYTVITDLGAAGSTTAADLQGMNGNKTINYALGSNIDATATSGWNVGAGFVAVGDNGSRFTGTFDGLGHTISDLTINQAGTNYVGLFGAVSSTGSIENIGLMGGSITAGSVVGGLVGLNYGSVSNSYVTGSVTGGSFVGGLVGSTRGNVSSSHASGAVIGNGIQIGGLAGGQNSGTISNSYATGNVTGGTDSAGGLVGYSASTISNSYATGAVSGAVQVGGILGAMNGGTVSSSYATGAVTGTDHVGGLVGNSANGTLSNNYAIGAVNGNTDVGGLIGSNTGATISVNYATGAVKGNSTVGALVGNNGGTVTNTYWNSTVNGALAGMGGGTTTGSTGLSSVQMQAASNFAGFTFTTTPGATGNNWVMVDVDGTLNNAGGALGGTRPMLASEYSTTINNAHQLQLMSMNLAGIYTVGRNIDAAATGTASDVWSGSTFIPVGSAAGKFAGTFNGQGHTISNLTVNLPTTQYVGLFGWTNGSTINNTGLLAGSVSGKDFVGGLVGLNDGSSISNSSNTGTVTATGNCAGGLVGANGDNVYSTIDNSYATGVVTGNGTNFYVGGLVGVQQHGAISNSYATGNVTNGGDTVGGLVGFLHSSNISNSYSSGTVAGTANVGGFVGYNIGSVGTSYWNTTANGGLTAVGGGSATGMTGLSTAQMQTASNFSAFNFTGTGGATGNNWVMVDIDGTLNNGGALGATRPMLASEYSTTINNDHQLQLMIMDLSANYTLGQNIDAAATGTVNNVWSSSTFVPVGKDSARFTGTLNGLGHTIGDLHINMPDSGLPGFSLTATADEAGLFGHIGASGSVQNVGLVGGSVVGRDFVGALVGKDDGTITNSYASTAVQGRGYLGGLVGHNTSTGTTTSSHATGSITANDGTAGGLVGLNEGVVSNDYATGAVQGLGNGVGGLVGINQNSISNSYASGSVNGSNYVGGLVGTNVLNGSGISNSYATGSVQGNGCVGGLIGLNYGNASNSYATGLVSGVGATGGLTGSSYGTVTNSFWNTETSGQAASSAGTGLTTQQMMQLSSFSNWNTATPNTIASTGSSGASWRIYEGHSAPLLTQFLTALTLNVPDVIATYDGSAHGSATIVPSNVFAASETNAGTYSALYSNQQGYDISGSGTLTINKANLTLSGTRAYDGSSSVAGSALTATGVAGETFSVTGAGNTSNLGSKNVQSGSTLASVTSLVLGTSANGGLSGNYNALSTAGSSVSITKAGLTLATGDVSKTYDGGLSALGTATVTNGSLFGSDAISGGTFAFTNANAGSSKTVTTTGVTVTDGNNGGNYNVIYANDTASTITQANLTLSTSNVSKTYDGGLMAAGTATVTSGTLFGSDALSGGTFAFTDKNVGSSKTVTIAGVTVTDGNSGGNYNVSYANNTASTITQANLTLSTSNVGKTYDGGLTAAGTATVTSGTLFGSDALSGGTFAFTDKNVGSNKTVTTAGVTVTDGNSGGNYNVSYANNTAGTITPYAVDLTGSRAYDGTTGLNAGMFTVGTLVGSETLTLGGFGTLADKNIGSGKSVTLGTLALGNGSGLAANYTLIGGTQTADVTARALTVSGTGTNKVYDGSTVAGVTLGDDCVASDALTLSDTSARFTDKNVAAGKTINVAGISVSGADAGNYTFNTTVATTADITAAGLTVSSGNVSKTYDGTTATAGTATVTGGTLFGSDVISGGTFAFTDKNAGSGNKTVTTTGVTLADGNSGGNYHVSYANNTNSTITPAILSATVAAPNKVYDGTTTAAPTLTITNGLIGSETLNATGTASFNSKDAATANLVTVGSTSLADGSNGGLASNYSLASGETAAAHITAKALTVDGMTATNKVYDGGATAILTGGTLSGLIGSETLAFSGQSGAFADKNVGADKAVTVTGITLGNGTALAGNYSITNPTGLTADITRLDSVTWTGAATGNWFDPANWAGGAVPDLANVANVVIPAGVTVSFDNGSVVSPAQAGTVAVDSIGSAGSMNLVDGNLSVTNNLQLASLDQSGGALSSAGNVGVDSFTQTGGSLSNTGDFTVTNSFSQSGGTVSAGGNVGITQASGSVALGNITAGGSLGVTAVTGNITQVAGTSIASSGTSTLAAPNGNVILASSGNDLGTTIASGSAITQVQEAVGSAISIASTNSPQDNMAGLPLSSGLSSSSSSAGSASSAGQSSHGLLSSGSVQDTLAGLNITVIGQAINLPPGVQSSETSDDKK